MKLIKGLIGLIIILVAAHFFLVDKYPGNDHMAFGVTFSPDYTQELGLDPNQIYERMLGELQVKKVRLVAYWKDIEPEKGQFNFDGLDRLIDLARQNNAEVILSIGYKLPRWPECHHPLWLNDKNPDQRQERLVIMLEEIVKRYENDPAVTTWQVENEPKVQWFGVCGEITNQQLREEVELVRSLSKKPIMLTDSGEWGLWVLPMQLSDIFGTTVYKKTYNQNFKTFVNYPFPAVIYSLKSDVVRKLFAPINQKTIIAELQAEVWPKDHPSKTPIDEQVKLFSLDDLKGLVEYGKKTGFEESYLWGVEWWYFMAAHGHPEYLNYAKTLF